MTDDLLKIVNKKIIHFVIGNLPLITMNIDEKYTFTGL